MGHRPGPPPRQRQTGRGAVERLVLALLIAKLTRRRLKRGVFRSIIELQAGINRFLRETNDDPKPKIIAAVKRGH